MERIKAKVLYEVYPIHLYHVHFGTELNLLGFFATNDGADIGFGYAYYPVGQTFACFKYLLLLPLNFSDYFTLLIIFIR